MLIRFLIILAVVLPFVFEVAAQEPEISVCPNCTASERYSYEISTLIDYANQIKALDEALDPLSSETISYLKELVDELPLGEASTTTIELAIANKDAADNERAQRLSLEILRQQTELEAARGNRIATQAVVSPDTAEDPLGILADANDVPDQRQGIFITFVRPSNDDNGEVVTMTLDSIPRSMRVGQVFEYQGESFELAQVQNAPERLDGRRYNVYVVNTQNRERSLVEWAR